MVLVQTRLPSDVRESLLDLCTRGESLASYVRRVLVQHVEDNKASKKKGGR